MNKKMDLLEIYISKNNDLFRTLDFHKIDLSCWGFSEPGLEESEVLTTDGLFKILVGTNVLWLLVVDLTTIGDTLFSIFIFF